MKYVALMYADPAATEAMSAAQRAEVVRRHEALHQDLAGSGEMLNGAGPAYPKDTTTIRWRGDGSGPAATEGPFAGAAEQLTAYYVIECASPERAREIAGRVVDFHVVAVEVRAVHDAFGMDAGCCVAGSRDRDAAPALPVVPCPLRHRPGRRTPEARRLTERARKHLPDGERGIANSQVSEPGRCSAVDASARCVPSVRPVVTSVRNGRRSALLAVKTLSRTYGARTRARGERNVPVRPPQPHWPRPPQ
ncbi:YciI family protein [Streptomyces sp. NPDC088354]|uniref:YciI family protein n=1 Tax=Streptomyces sp. NPDC088354 TaxID=3365856 RepID=UPI0037FA63B4